MASKSPQLILLFALILSLTLVLNAAAQGGRAGGWKAIPNTNDPEVVEIAKFAVNEYNKGLSKGVLTYEKVVKAESQVVAGTNYKLTIKTTSSGGESANYEAVVWDKPWQHFRQLTSFKKV